MSFYGSPEDMHLGRDKKMPTSSQLCYSLSLASASLAVVTLPGVQCSQAALPVGDRTMCRGGAARAQRGEANGSGHTARRAERQVLPMDVVL